MPFSAVMNIHVFKINSMLTNDLKKKSENVHNCSPSHFYIKYVFNSYCANRYKIGLLFSSAEMFNKPL